MSLAAIVLMGVSGAGKSTVGPLLGAALGWPFEDGDAFHPAANVAKMSAGVALADEDRWPWLEALAARIAAARASGAGVVVGCSALKRAYRDALRAGFADVRFVHLSGSAGLIGGRQAARPGHFMPASLLASQFATLELPEHESDALSVSVDASPAEVTRAIVAELRGRGDLA
jgi:gluconokinase